MIGSKSPSYICDICKGEFKFEDIKYGKDGKKVLCKSCYTKNLKPDKKDEKSANQADPDKVKVICMGCRYKFSLKKKTTTNPTCPYCGKSNLMIDNTTAEKLIEDVSSNSSRYD